MGLYNAEALAVHTAVMCLQDHLGVLNYVTDCLNFMHI